MSNVAATLQATMSYLDIRSALSPTCLVTAPNQARWTELCIHLQCPIAALSFPPVIVRLVAGCNSPRPSWKSSRYLRQRTSQSVQVLLIQASAVVFLLHEVGQLAFAMRQSAACNKAPKYPRRLVVAWIISMPHHFHADLAFLHALAQVKLIVITVQASSELSVLDKMDTRPNEIEYRSVMREHILC